MTPASLLLSSQDDPNAEAVAFGLEALGVRVLRAPSYAEAELGPLSVATDGTGGWALKGAGLSGELRSVWYRRPRAPRPPRGTAPADAAFVTDEWAQFQKNLFAMGPAWMGALWVNEPRAAVHAENKLAQLEAARRAGVPFPETLMSNDPAEVRAFLGARGRAIFKTFTAHTWKDGATGALNNAAAVLLDAAEPLDEAVVALCPGIYQAYVDKRADLRVTFIGDRCFPVRLTRREGGAFVDWRPRTFMPDLQAEPCALPEDFERRLRALMARLGLVFGCVDLVEDLGGGLHFLEVNQGGQFLFLEELVPELPLLRALCSMLAEGRTDFALAEAPVSMARYRDSGAHQAWEARRGGPMGVQDWLVSVE